MPNERHHLRQLSIDRTNARFTIPISGLTIVFGTGLGLASGRYRCQRSQKRSGRKVPNRSRLDPDSARKAFSPGLRLEDALKAETETFLVTGTEVQRCRLIRFRMVLLGSDFRRTKRLNRPEMYASCSHGKQTHLPLVHLEHTLKAPLLCVFGQVMSVCHCVVDVAYVRSAGIATFK